MAKDKLTTRDGAEDELDKSSALRAPKVTELIPMSGIRGIYQKVKRKVNKVIIAAVAASAITSAKAGESVRDIYRTWADYHPDEKSQAESSSKTGKKLPETPKSKKSTFEGIIDKARDYGSGAVDQIAENTELGRKYAELKRQLDWLLNIKENVLDAGDKFFYYTAIIVTFLAMMKILTGLHKLVTTPDSKSMELNIKIGDKRIAQLEKMQDALFAELKMEKCVSREALEKAKAGAAEVRQLRNRLAVLEQALLKKTN